MKSLQLFLLTAVLAAASLFGQAAAPAKAPAKPAATAPASLIDINSATAAELKAVPGIGDVYAAKIIAGRPYKNITQLKSNGILPAGVYAKVKGSLIAKQK
jgi:DNA uptake protein ComE-like DNA-binding protein